MSDSNRNQSNRVARAAKVAEELLRLTRRQEKENKITVVSAIKLSKKQIQRMEEFFHSTLGKPYEIENTVSPDLIGGIRIQWEDWILDMTLKKRLKNLAKAI